MKSIRKPDLNAPRFRNKASTLMVLDTLEKFKEKYPKYQHITMATFKKIIMTFNGNLTEGIIENRNGVQLPDGLGYIFMGSCPKAKKENINYKKSLEFGIRTNHKNWDSDNRLLKIFYTNRTSKYPFRNKQVWAFQAVRQFKRAASAAFVEDWTKYIEVTATQKVSGIFDRYRKKEQHQNLKVNIPDDYDEFKI